MNMVYSKTKEQVKLYSIHYSYNDIQYRLNKGDNFLSRILLPENCLYQESSLFMPCYRNHLCKFKEIKQIWELRINAASYFKNKADVVDIEYNETARMVLLSQSLMQTCAALLWIHWEWKPHYYDLDLLLNLCKNFSKSPSLVLPRKSFTSNKTYSYLCHAQHNLNFKTTKDVTLKDSNYAIELTKRFFNSVLKEGNTKLKDLELIHNFES